MSDEHKLSLITSYQLLELIKNQKINVKICELNENSPIFFINKLESIPHASASESQTFFSVLVGTVLENTSIPIAIKMFSSDNKELEYETKVYQKITRDIINNNFSPNFVGYVGYGCCSYEEILKYLDDIKEKTYLYNFLNENKNKSLCLLITEKIGNGMHFGFNSMLPVYSLKDFYFYTNTLDIITVLFQLIYSLCVLSRFRINHNDLHPYNILVMKLPEYISMGFIVGDKKYQIKTKYVPYIFDWDVAYVDELGDNPTIERRRNYGLKNDFSSKFDLYLLLCYLEPYKSLPKGHSLVKHETFVHLEGEDQEEYLYIPISQSEYDTLSQFDYMINVNNNPIYKLSGLQLESVIGIEKMNLIGKNITSVMFYLNKTNVGTFLAIVKDKNCRMTVISSDFPTPLEMLETDFKEYEVDEFENTNYVYKLPSVIGNRRIYIKPGHSGYVNKMENQIIL